MHERATKEDSGAGPERDRSQAARSTLDPWLALQRSAGNRAVRRLLARETKVKGGVETKVVSPAVRKLLDDKQIPYAREVTFELLDDGGKAVLRGRFDVVFRTPDTKELVFPELKGDKLDALTKGQKVYVPMFESKAGGRVRIISSSGGKLYLPQGSEEQVHGKNFLRVGSANLRQFTAHVEEMATGTRATNVYYGPEGLRAYSDQKDFEKFLESKGIPTQKPAKASVPAADKPLKPPKPAVDQKHPLHDPPAPKPKPQGSSRADPTSGPPANPARKGPNFKPQPYDPDRPAKQPPPVQQPQAPPVQQPQVPPATSGNRARDVAKQRAQGSNRADQTSGGRSKIGGGGRSTQQTSVGVARGPWRQAAGVLIQGAVNWSGDKALNHHIASEMLRLWPKIVDWRAQFPNDKIVFEVWIEEWEQPGPAGTGRMVHDVSVYHGATEADVERQIAQAGRLAGPDKGWRLVGPYMGWIEPYENLAELKKKAENEKCFIATACCGSPDAAEVLVLRAFRDQVLQPRRAGRTLMRAYYRTSPAPARVIARRPRLRRAVRGALVAPAAAAARQALDRTA